MYIPLERKKQRDAETRIIRSASEGDIPTTGFLHPPTVLEGSASGSRRLGTPPSAPYPWVWFQERCAEEWGGGDKTKPKDTRPTRQTAGRRPRTWRQKWPKQADKKANRTANGKPRQTAKRAGNGRGKKKGRDRQTSVEQKGNTTHAIQNTNSARYYELILPPSRSNHTTRNAPESY